MSEVAGEEAIQLAESVGLFLDPWQELGVRVTLAERADGLYASQEVGELVSRQQGKGGGLEAVVLHGMFLVRDPLTLWTAHQFKTSTEAFLRMRGWIDGSDDLRRKVARVNASHGEEGIELLPKFGGARLRFLARSKSSGRGFSPQRIIFDEAQELATVAYNAMWPSTRAQRNRQGIFKGTVPGPEVNSPEHWTRMRDRGRAGTSPRLAWLEYTPDRSGDPDTARLIDRSDPRVWLQASPGLGYRDGLTLESIADDRESMESEAFDREVLSIWPSVPDGATVFGAGKWAAGAQERPDDLEPSAFAVEVAPDLSWACLAAAGQVGGVTFVKPLEHHRGTAWVVETAARIVGNSTLVIDGHSQAAALIEDLEAAGVRILIASTADVADGCAQFFEDVQEEAIGHSKYPELETAVKGAVKQPMGDRWKWGWKSATADISPLKAVTLAAWAVADDYDLKDPIL